MPKKPIVFYSHKCPHSKKLLGQLQQSGTINAVICINVSKPSTYSCKIPPQIRSVPCIMNTNGQVLTGNFARQFISTALPQMMNEKNGGMAPHPSTQSSQGPVGEVGARPSIAGEDRRKMPAAIAPSAKTSANVIAQQQLDNQRGGGLQSANFGTQFSEFSYLPGSNDLQESFYDFEYLNSREGPSGGMGGGQSGASQNTSSSVPGMSKKAQDLQKRMDAMQAARAVDLKRAGARVSI